MYTQKVRARGWVWGISHKGARWLCSDLTSPGARRHACIAVQQGPQHPVNRTDAVEHALLQAFFPVLHVQHRCRPR
eukprot:COSAG01_NODE_514_length_16043_cov_248.614212_9_plen_76_part_00